MTPSHSIRPDHVVFDHGSSTSCGITDMICPPVDTNVISEKGRNKNLDRVFFTADMGLARIYAGRAARSIGGEPVLFRVVCPVDVVEMNTTPGASVYHAAWAFVEQIQ